MRKMIILCMFCLALFSVMGVSQEVKQDSQPNNSKPQLEYDKKINSLNAQLDALKLKLEEMEQQNSQAAEDVSEIVKTTTSALKGIESSNREISNYIKSQKASFNDLENKDVDIAHSIATDWPAVLFNFFAITLSAYISYRVVRKTLNNEAAKQNEILVNENEKYKETLERETKKQNDLIIEERNKRKEELDHQISASNKNFQQQYERTISEFRQGWINDFRLLTSELIGNTYQILSYSDVDAISLFKTKDYRIIRRKLSLLSQEIKDGSLDHNLYLVKLEELKLLQAIYEEHPYYKVKELESKIIGQIERLIMMLNSKDIVSENEKSNDFPIYKSLTNLEELFTNISLSSALRNKQKEIKQELVELRKLTSEMLKKEWNRVQRK
ncbi:hypothetical protein [Pseudoalteromonas umbrosa]|uniref:hypothetical protein n=1 Tax=Pseudoalteromonas umbrosa TaxID=3048489 RepID=UPI0024C2717E|nr:hypothetical protein [Pseudoalteromonas sp. B95]MDK1289821.1 hypothetical protein [Pseudoalteromonas sp. B95]